MDNRLLNVPFNQTDYNTEVNTIKYMAQENGYEPQLIESLIKKWKSKKIASQLERNSHREKIHNTNPSQQIHTKIAKSIKKLEYNIAYTTNKTTHNTKHEKHTSTLVYKLKCNDCSKYYIGQTGRSFKTRYTEHIKAFTQPLLKSHFAEHIFNTSYIHQYWNKPINFTCTTKRPQTKHHRTIWDIQTL